MGRAGVGCYTPQVLPPWRGGWVTIFTLTFVVSVLLGDQSFAAHFAVDDQSFRAESFAWWAPLSAPFSIPESALSYLAVHFAVQWFWGGRLEAFWGRRRYLVFCLGCGVLGYAATAALMSFGGSAFAEAGAAAGPHAIDLAVLLAFARVFSRERYALPGLQGPMSALALAGFGALAVVGAFALQSPTWGVYLPPAFALLVAAAFLFQPWRRSPKSGKLGRAKGAPHLRVVRTPDDLLN